jgi:hypothetical protein
LIVVYLDTLYHVGRKGLGCPRGTPH